MATGDDAYLLKYRGNQLGDELVDWTPALVAQPVSVVPLYGSTLAGIHRNTPGKAWRYTFDVYAIKATAHEAIALAAGWHQYVDGDSGVALVQQNLTTPATVATYNDLFMESITRRAETSAARARILQATITFVGGAPS